MQNLLFGGLSGMAATSVIQPIDFLKVQIQVQSEMGRGNIGPIKIAKEVIAKEGSVFALYRGIDSALLRQMVYCSIRFGVFYWIKDLIKKQQGREANFLENSAASLVSGAIGSLAGNPFDLALIRMQSDNNLPKEERRNYRNVFDAIGRTLKEEGVLTLWRGCLPTVVRAMSMNFAMMTSFEEAKKLIGKFVENNRAKAILASFISGFFAAFMSLPFDNVKTKLQKMKALPDGTLPYRGVTDCIAKSIRKEGFLKLWVGFNTFYARVAPHAIIALLVNEALRNKFAAKK